VSRTLHPGFRFKEGRLFIFSSNEAISIDGWPGLEATRRKVSRGRTEPIVPAFRLLRPRARQQSAAAPAQVGPQGITGSTVHQELERATAFNGFRYTMPPEVAEACQRFAGRQWRVLRFCVDNEPAIELLQQNPALGFCLAHHASLRPGQAASVDGVRVATRSKQRDILEWLDFPGTEAMVRILRKVQPETIHLERLRQLRDAARRPAVLQALSHLQQINVGVQGLLFDPVLAESVTPNLLAEVSECHTELTQSEVTTLVRTFQEMWRVLQPRRAVRKFESIARLREEHREVSVEYSRLQLETPEKIEFPSPPLPGTGDILPLVTAQELEEEGREQSNCVATYRQWVRTGGGYIYRVLRPQRATLSITRGQDGCWQAEELKLKGNQPPGADTIAAVKDWLRRYSLSA
jgi:hypothetical protein